MFSKFRHRIACEADEMMEYYGSQAYDIAWKREQAAREKLRLLQFIFWRRVAEYIWQQDHKNPVVNKPKVAQHHTNFADMIADQEQAERLAKKNLLN